RAVSVRTNGPGPASGLRAVGAPAATQVALAPRPQPGVLAGRGRHDGSKQCIRRSTVWSSDFLLRLAGQFVDQGANAYGCKREFFLASMAVVIDAFKQRV